MNIEKNGSNSINNTQKLAEKCVISSQLPTGCMRKVTYNWSYKYFLGTIIRYTNIIVYEEYGLSYSKKMKKEKNNAKSDKNS